MKTVHPSVYRASILHFLSDPLKEDEHSYEYFEDGVLVVDEGKVIQLGDANALLAQLDHPAKLVDLRGQLIIPGFVDTHLHYPQIDIMASYGDTLLDWLNHYTFPAEQAYKDPRRALEAAEFFLDELLKNGTTTAMVFGSVHKTSVNAFFEASQTRNTRMICGKVMMDRRAPQALCDTAEESYQDSSELIERWHQKGRQQYAVTPRFAITSSPAQLEVASQLLRETPGLMLQTHLSENEEEIALTLKLFPKARDYLDVYEGYDLVGENSVFAHAVHVSDSECQRLAEHKATIAFCPSSNLFLGSGLTDIAKFDQHGLAYSLASDIGAGTRISMLHTMAEAYKVCRSRGYQLNALRSFYLATLGGAQALGLENKIGSFKPGNEADFVVLNYDSTSLMKRRQEQCESLSDKLFALLMLGDERCITSTYVAGKRMYHA
jgi:guanine deaminase